MTQFTDYNVIEIGTYNEAVYMMEASINEAETVLLTGYHDPDHCSVYLVSVAIIDENGDVIDSDEDAERAYSNSHEAFDYAIDLIKQRIKLD